MIDVPLRIHLTFAYAATAGGLAATVSGLLHLLDRIPRRGHAWLAWVFTVLAVGAVATGTWIFLVGEPKV